MYRAVKIIVLYWGLFPFILFEGLAYLYEYQIFTKKM
jgi:hypothetical protein